MDPGEARFAVVSGYASAWVLRQGVDSRKVRESVAWLRSVGRPDLAGQLAAGVHQLLLAAEEHRATAGRVDVGTVEPVGLRSEAVSVVEEITVRCASQTLGVSEGMVRRWCRGQVLAARQPHRNQPWIVELRSALDLLEARRSAHD
jgi:hypothetical protein